MCKNIKSGAVFFCVNSVTLLFSVVVTYAILLSNCFGINKVQEEVVVCIQV